MSPTSRQVEVPANRALEEKRTFPEPELSQARRRILWRQCQQRTSIALKEALGHKPPEPVRITTKKPYDILAPGRPLDDDLAVPE